MSKMIIKNLELKDINKLMYFENKFFGEISEDKEVIIDRIKTFNQGCIGIFENGNLIGYCSSEIWINCVQPKVNLKASINHNNEGKILYISGMVIDTKYQKQGFGSKLLNKIIEIAKSNNLEKIYLRTSYPKSIKFWKRNGFQIKDHITTEKEDYHIMFLNL